MEIFGVKLKGENCERQPQEQTQDYGDVVPAQLMTPLASTRKQLAAIIATAEAAMQHLQAAKIKRQAQSIS